MPSLGRHTLSVTVVAAALAAMSPFAASTASAAGLAKPAGLAPSASGSTTDPTQVQKDPVLSWDAVAGATRYRVQLDKNENWDSSDLIALPNNGVTSFASFALPQSLPHGEYWWRVRAENGSSTSGWSDDAQLYRGWLDAPTVGNDPGNDSTVDWSAGGGVSTAPWRFSWTAIPDASSYQIEVSTSPSFPPTGTVQDDKSQTSVECLTTHTSFTPYSSVFNKDTNVDECDFADVTSGPFFWRVRGVDDSASDTVSTTDQNPLLCGGVTHDATDGAETTAAALGNPGSTTQECSLWSATGTVGGLVAGSGDFTKADLGATAPDASLSCTTSCTDTPEVRWTPVGVASSLTAVTEYASHYRVTIADDPNFTTIERKYNTPFLTLQPRDQLRDYTAGDGYYVSVQACNDQNAVPAGEAVCGTPAVLHFTKRSPRVDGLTATSVPGGERFVWNDLLSQYPTAMASPAAPAVEAEHYTVEVAKAADGDFARPVLSTTVDRSCDTANVAGCYRPGVSAGAGKGQLVARLADGDYSWRVVPVDLSGNRLRGSLPQAVTVDTTAPSFRLTDRSPHADNRALHIRASEASVAGVTSSTLKLVQVVGGGSVAGTLVRTSSSSWTFKPGAPLVPGQKYALSVTSAIHDAAGNLAVVSGSPVRVSGVVDDKNPAWRFTAGWSRVSSSSAFGHTFVHGRSGKSAAVHVVGGTVSVYACKAPRLGHLRITVDGVTKASPSLAQSFTSCGVRVWRGSVSNNRVHTVRLTAVRGAVDLDRLVVS